MYWAISPPSLAPNLYPPLSSSICNPLQVGKAEVQKAPEASDFYAYSGYPSTYTAPADQFSEEKYGRRV